MRAGPGARGSVSGSARAGGFSRRGAALPSPCVASVRAQPWRSGPNGPDRLVVREVPRPEPRPGWALVRVEAFGLNRSEYMTLRGWSGDAVH